MRGCVQAVLLLLVLFFPFGAAAQCDWTPRFSGQFRTTALDVALDGDIVWVATGYGVQLLSNDTIVDSLALPGMTSVIAVDRNGYAYAGSGSRIAVLRRDGTDIHVVRTFNTAATVNDIVLVGWMFVATSAGIQHYSLLDPASPARTAVTMTTSSANVRSLALDGTTLLAADGDASVETFSIANPSMPQSTGALTAMQYASAVHASPDGRILVSDALGRNTDVFISGVRVARLPIGANAFAGDATGTHFLAGVDRTVRAIDLSSPATLVELLELQLAPTDGTDNVVHSMVRSGERVYVAAGDLGVITLDASKLALPRPMVAYPTGRTSSVRTDGTKAWFTTADGRITEQTIDRNGLAMMASRTWSVPSGSVVRDQNGNLLLTTSGTTATLWDLGSTNPVAGATMSFSDAIAAAVLTDSSTIVLLANGTLWAAPRGETTPVKLQTPAAAFLARSGNAVALAELRPDAKTVIHYSASADFGSGSRQFTVDGVAAGSLALDATHAAVFTFQGVTTVDLLSGSMRVVRDSARIIPRQLILADGDLLLLDFRSLLVYERTERLVREHALPDDTVAADYASSITALATAEGVAVLSHGRELPSPKSSYASAFYSKAVASGDHAWLQQKDGVDGWSLTGRGTPHFVAGIRAGGIVDIAAEGSTLFTVAGNGTVTAWSAAGTLLAQRSVVEGSDSRPLAIRSAAGAVWLAVSWDCGSGVCRQTKTFVLDPKTLATTDTLSGRVRETTESGATLYALFNTPDELRRYTAADPLHPAQTASIVAPPSATSLATSADAVHVIADRVYSYDGTTLAATGVRLDPVSVTDRQQIRIAANCAVIAGRSEMPQLYALGAWSPAPAIEIPSEIRSVAMAPGRLLLLTDHSIEVWSSASLVTPARRRAIR